MYMGPQFCIYIYKIVVPKIMTVCEISLPYAIRFEDYSSLTVNYFTYIICTPMYISENRYIYTYIYLYIKTESKKGDVIFLAAKVDNFSYLQSSLQRSIWELLSADIAGSTPFLDQLGS